MDNYHYQITLSYDDHDVSFEIDSNEPLTEEDLINEALKMIEYQIKKKLVLSD